MNLERFLRSLFWLAFFLVPTICTGFSRTIEIDELLNENFDQPIEIEYIYGTDFFDSYDLNARIAEELKSNNIESYSSSRTVSHGMYAYYILITLRNKAQAQVVVDLFTQEGFNRRFLSVSSKTLSASKDMLSIDVMDELFQVTFGEGVRGVKRSPGQLVKILQDSLKNERTIALQNELKARIMNALPSRLKQLGLKILSGELQVEEPSLAAIAIDLSDFSQHLDQEHKMCLALAR